MSFMPKIHEIYKHFKGNLYQVTAIAEHTETGEMLVVYQDLYSDVGTYARPLSMFVSRVDKEKYPDAAQEFRFELQGPEAERQRAESDKAESNAAEPNKAEAYAAKSDIAGSNAVVSEGIQKGAEARLGSGNRNDKEQKEEETGIDPLVLEFLDADSYGQQLNILAGLHHRITDDMITTMAVACDIEINEGDVEERYEALRTCLLTLERYECQRLR